MQCVNDSFPRQFLGGFFRSARATASLLLVLVLTSACSATTITFTEAGVSTEGTPLLVSARLDTAADAGGPNNLLKITLSGCQLMQQLVESLVVARTTGEQFAQGLDP